MIYFDNPGFNHADKLAILDVDQVLVDLLTELDRFMVTEYGPSLGHVAPLHTCLGYYGLDERYPWVQPGTSSSYIAAFAHDWWTVAATMGLWPLRS